MHVLSWWIWPMPSLPMTFGSHGTRRQVWPSNMASGVCDYLSVWICVNNMAMVTLWVHHGHAHLRPFCVARHARHAHAPSRPDCANAGIVTLYFSRPTSFVAIHPTAIQDGKKSRLPKRSPKRWERGNKKTTTPPKPHRQKVNGCSKWQWYFVESVIILWTCC
jgi:hypothetical protein